MAGWTDQLARGEARWVLRRCSRKGHVLARVDDAELRAVLEVVAPVVADGTLLRCTRCGAWVEPDDVVVGEVIGTDGARATVADLPLSARGSHGRKLAILRLLAVERFAKGVVLILGSAVSYRIAADRVPLLGWIDRVLNAAAPLGRELGLHLTGSAPVHWIERTLSGDGGAIRLAGLGLLAYGSVQVVEGVGLWGGWRWAEYLAAIATSAFVPWEVYELLAHPTPVKAGALLINVVAVTYLVFKGRLFGVRGGHPGYVEEVRDATLIADLLRSLGRSPEELRSTRIV
jgi:uncharacterized membrane protein (DUF2068 family)